MSDIWEDQLSPKPPAPASPRKKRTWVLPAIIAGVIAGTVLSIFVCCGGVLHFGMGLVAEGVWKQVEADPRFTAHVGQVKKFRLEYGASMVAGEDVLVYEVEATKWSGRVTVKSVTDDNDEEQIEWVRFTLASGEAVELTPAKGPATPNQDEPEPTSSL